MTPNHRAAVASRQSRGAGARRGCRPARRRGAHGGGGAWGRNARRTAVLSLLVPGLGHLYAGDPRRGAVVWVASRVVTAVLLEAAGGMGGRPGLAVQIA